jgi:O-antigen/teichoic acid export membrane protein
MSGQTIDGIGPRAVRSVLWMSSGSYAGFAVSFVAGVILARLLEPAHFGVVALAYAILALTNAFASWDLDAHVIASGEQDEKVIASTALAMKTMASGAVFLLDVVLALVIMPVYGRTVVLCLVALGFIRLAAAPFSIYKALLLKRFMMKQRAALLLISALAWASSAIGTALLGCGLWSLVIAQAAGALVGGTYVVLVQKPRYLPAWDRVAAKGLWNFGRRSFGSSLLKDILNHADDVVVGSLVSAGVLGLYSRSRRIAELLEVVVAPPIANTALPVFAALRDRKEELSRSVELVLCMITRITVPFFVITGLLAPEIVGVIYGDKWLGVVPIYRALMLYGMLSPLLEICRHLVYAKGYPGLTLRIRLIQALFFLPGIGLFAYLWSVIGAAACIGVSVLIGTVLSFAAVSKLADIGTGRVILPPVLAGMTAAAMFFLLDFWLGPDCSRLLRLACLGVPAVLAYGMGLWVIEGKWLMKNGRAAVADWRGRRP